MQIKTIQHEEFIKDIEIYKQLLKISYTINFNISNELGTSIAEIKVNELEEYVKTGRAILIGAFSNTELAGFIWGYKHKYFNETRLHVNQLIVKKQYRGHGLAKRLLKQTEQLALDMKIKTIDLYVTENNFAATNMYENFGFVTERRYFKKNLGEEK